MLSEASSPFFFSISFFSLLGRREGGGEGQHMSYSHSVPDTDR